VVRTSIAKSLVHAPHPEALPMPRKPQRPAAAYRLTCLPISQAAVWWPVRSNLPLMPV